MDTLRSRDTPWEEMARLRQAQQIVKVRRAQARYEEYLDGLLILVGNRGASYIAFDVIFEKSDDPEYRKAVTAVDTVETRRNLFTILKALTEVPRSWATSAFLRFLRGMGKQKDTKYHGMGTFGQRYGWKEEEVKSICLTLTAQEWGSNPYSAVLMSYADVESEIREEDPNYVVTSYSATFSATRATRDVDFLNKLCSLLDSRGLGPVPTPADVKPKKDRKTKVFHSGDIINKSSLRDLPLPAHVMLPITRLDSATNQWVDSTIEHVVTELVPGRYRYAVVTKPDSKIAYPTGSYDFRPKDDLIGATFLGEWDGSIDKTKKVTTNSYYQRKK